MSTELISVNQLSLPMRAEGNKNLPENFSYYSLVQMMRKPFDNFGFCVIMFI